MTEPRSRARFPSRPIVLSAVTAVLVFLVALGSVRPLASAGGDRRLLDLRPMMGDLFVLLLAVLLGEALLLAYFVSSYLKDLRAGDAATRAPARTSFWRRLIASLSSFAVVAVLLVVVAERRKGQLTGDLGFTPVPTVPLPDGLQTAGTPLVVHWWFVTALVLVVVAIATPAFIRRLRGRAERRPPEQIPEQEELRLAVEASLGALEDVTDPRQAVVRAYAHMERLLSSHGLTRRPAETPFEYLSRCLRTAPGGGHAAETLTVLYEQARFSHHPIDDGMRREAAAALLALRDNLVEQAG